MDERRWDDFGPLPLSLCWRIRERCRLAQIPCFRHIRTAWMICAYLLVQGNHPWRWSKSNQAMPMEGPDERILTETDRDPDRTTGRRMTLYLAPLGKVRMGRGNRAQGARYGNQAGSKQVRLAVGDATEAS